MTALTPSLQFDFKSISDKTLTDHSGNNYDGTVEPGCAIVNDPVMGNCMEFDGATGYVKLPSLPGTGVSDFSNGMTITAWVNLAVENNACIIDLYSGDSAAPQENISFQAGNGQPYFFNGLKSVQSDKPIQPGQWHHLAITLSSSGDAFFYLNGLPTTAIANESGITLVTTQYSSNFIGKGVGGNKTTELFKGKLAWLSVYNQALTQDQINSDMLLGEQNRNASFRKSFPVEFSLYSENNSSYVPVLYIEDASTSTGEKLYLEIINNSTQSLNIPKATGTASSSPPNFHFQLHFRPGTLSDKFLQNNKLTIDHWSVVVKPGSAGTGTDCIIFLRTGASITLTPGESHVITIDSVNANPIGGARNTNVEFLYSQLTLGTGSSETIHGRRLQHLSLVGHLGQKNIPLHVDTVGSPTILNDGKKANELLFRIENTGSKSIPLSTSATDGKSKFEVGIQIQPVNELMEWALVDESDTSGLKLDWPVVGVVETATTDSVNFNLEEPVSNKLSIGMSININQPTGVVLSAKLAAPTASGSATISLDSKQTIEKGSIVSLVSIIGTVEESTTGSKTIKLQKPILNALAKGTQINIQKSTGVVTATLASKASAGQAQLTIDSVQTIDAGTVIAVASNHTLWDVLDDNSIPAGTTGSFSWTITNESATELGSGESIDFLIKGITCSLPSGQTFITLKYFNIPGFWDGEFRIPVQKSPIVTRQRNVGIGTDSPTTALDVNGQAHFTGNVGIGTDSPSQLLDVKGNASIGNLGMGGSTAVPTEDVRLQISPASNTGTVHLRMQHDNIDTAFMKSDGTKRTIEIGANSGSHVCIKQITGNVGIGTDSPKTALDVKGDGHFTGNVGIGTASPKTELDVGTGKITAATIRVNGPDSSGSTCSLSLGGYGDFHIDSDGVKGGRFIVQNGGNVGIGTATPEAPLHVKLSREHIMTCGFGYLNGAGTSTQVEGNTTRISIKADQMVLASMFFAASDLRIKNNLNVSIPHEDLQTLLQLEITDYQYIDKVGHGDRKNKGLIAQQVEKVLPEAVNQSTDFIPDIYAMADQLEVDEEKKLLTITLDKVHELKVGDLLRLITDDGEVQKEVSQIVNKNSFIVKEWTETTKQLFVLGKQVDDFRSVDYDQVAMLGISAMQQLHKEVEELKQENLALRNQLKSEMKSVQDELAEMRQFMNDHNTVDQLS